MGCPLLFFRPLLSLVFGLIAFLAFFAYLLFNLVDGHVLSADFYAEALAENEVYVRLYDEVLVDPVLEDETKELLGNIDVPPEDVADVAKRIMPPAYLQDETERTLDGLIDYLKKDTDDLELYIDLAEPLENAARELVVYAEHRIDEIEVETVTRTDNAPSADSMDSTADTDLPDDPSGSRPDDEAGSLPDDPSGSLPDASELQRVIERIEEGGTIQVEQIELETEEDWAKYWEDTLRELEQGQLPSQVPSLANVDVKERLEGYDLALEKLRGTADVPQEVLDALEDPETDGAIREVLASEDPVEEREAIKQALKVASAGVLPPLIDNALDDVRRKLATPEGIACEDLPEGADLSRCTRYDVLAWVDEDIEGTQNINEARDSIQLLGLLGSWLPRVVLIGACILLVMVNLPRLVTSLRWLGLVLGLTGAFFFIIGVLVRGSIPDRLGSEVQKMIEKNDGPASVAALSSDVTSSMADILSLSVTSPSMTMMVVGAVLFTASLLIRRIPVVRSLPFVSSLLG